MQTGNGLANQPTASNANNTRNGDIITEEVITPALAEKMLKQNRQNRPIRDTHVAFLVNEMVTGNWESMNGDTIIFHRGVLIDGQHRLKAVVLSGVTIRSYVVHKTTGDRDKIRQTKGNGAVRTAADELAAQGEKDCKGLASVVVAVDRYFSAIDAAGSSASEIPFSSQTRSANKTTYVASAKHHTAKLPQRHIPLLVARYPHTRESAAYGKAQGKRKPRLLSPNHWGLLHFIYHEIDSDCADRFLEALCTGENLTRQSPILQLRERLLSITTDSKNNSSFVGTQIVLGLANAAWNAYRTDKPINLKKITAGDPIQIAK